MFRLDAIALICNGKDDSRPLGVGAYGDDFTLRTVFDGVADQVDQRLLNQRRINHCG